MKVKIPKQIKVAGHWWTIELEKDLSRRHGKYGYVDADSLVIHIEPTILDSLKTHTLIHELIHTISDNFVNANAFSEDVTHEFAVGTFILLTDLGMEFDWSDIKGES